MNNLTQRERESISYQKRKEVYAGKLLFNFQLKRGGSSTLGGNPNE